jgi:hypothetical protein
MTKSDIMTVPKQPQFKDQGGAATMDPSALRRWITSKLMRRMSSERYLSRRRIKAEKQRQKKNIRPIVSNIFTSSMMATATWLRRL